MIFLSKILELRLVMKPKWITQDPATGVVVHPGQTIEFQNGRYETDDEAEIEFIKARPGFGSKITSVEKGDIPGGPSVLTGAVGTGGDPHKRTFKCIRCGVAGFESGFEVAKHRKSGECDKIIAESGGESVPVQKSEDPTPSREPRFPEEFPEGDENPKMEQESWRISPEEKLPDRRL